MNEADDLKAVIESRHGRTATFVQSVPIRETLPDSTVWEGVVYVFELMGHPKATCAYGWSAPMAGTARPQFVAVLRTGEVGSPLDAIHAALGVGMVRRSCPSLNLESTLGRL